MGLYRSRCVPSEKIRPAQYLARRTTAAPADMQARLRGSRQPGRPAMAVRQTATSSKSAGITRATEASRSIRDWTLTTSCSPAASAKPAMTSSGTFPNVTFRRPPMPGPEREARSSVARPSRAAVGMTGQSGENYRRVSVGFSKPDGDRDERHQQVGPAPTAQQEVPQLRP